MGLRYSYFFYFTSSKDTYFLIEVNTYYFWIKLQYPLLLLHFFKEKLILMKIENLPDYLILKPCLNLEVR